MQVKKKSNPPVWGYAFANSLGGFYSRHDTYFNRYDQEEKQNRLNDCTFQKEKTLMIQVSAFCHPSRSCQSTWKRSQWLSLTKFACKSSNTPALPSNALFSIQYFDSGKAFRGLWRFRHWPQYRGAQLSGLPAQFSTGLPLSHRIAKAGHTCCLIGKKLP